MKHPHSLPFLRHGGHEARRSGFLAAFLPLAAALLISGCKGDDAASAGSAVLYVYDGATGSVLSWNDISPIFDASAAGAPDRQLRSSKLSGLTIGWGGLTLDSYRGYLYMVSTGGTVVRMARAGSQNGDVPSSDTVSFSIDDSGTDAASGVFGQAAVDPTGNTLYITENVSSNGKTQVWVVPVSLMVDGATLGSSALSRINVSSDRYGTGVAASSTAVFAYCDSGGTITSGGIDYTQARLRMTDSGGGFPVASNVIVGKNDNSVTLLGKYGALAYDTGNDRLYFGRHNTDAGATSNPLLAFTPSQFSPGLEVAPAATYAGPSTLRMIAHAGQKDWLAGATGGSTLWLWKAPKDGDTSVSLSLTGPGGSPVSIYGIALDGSN